MNSIHMRPYTDNDYEMLSQWWHAHGKQRRPEQMLPKCGVVCELDGKPVSALFLHMDNSCGMCMADHAVSAPRLNLKTARIAFQHCVDCIKKIARDLGYHTIAITTYAGIARILKKRGFVEISADQVALINSTKEFEEDYQ